MSSRFPVRQSEQESSNLATARRYLETIESGTVGDDLASFLCSDIEHVELPNRLTPNGKRNDLAGMLESARQGQAVLQRQHYDVRTAIASGDTVMLEVRWTGTLARRVGTLAPGQEMRAFFVVVLEFREGRIARQRNYDCFEPF